MSKLLFKVAKELNVGTGTIVEHLNKKGFEIDNKPNAKVTDEMFNELTKQFQASIMEKEKADQIVIGSRPMHQPQLQKKEIPTPVFNRDKPVLGILNQHAATNTPPVSVVVEEPATPTAEPQPEPVVLPVVEIEMPVQPSVAPEVEAPIITANEDTHERVKMTLRGTKVLGKIDLDRKKPQQKVAPVKVEEKEEAIVEVKSTPVVEQTPVVERKVVETPSADEPEVVVVDPNAPDMYRADTPTLKGLKILGKIDTDKFDKSAAIRKKERDRKKDIKDGIIKAVPGVDTPGTESEEAAKRKRKRKKVTAKPLTQDSIKDIGQGNAQNRGPAGSGSAPNRTGPQRPGSGQGVNRPAAGGPARTSANGPARLTPNSRGAGGKEAPKEVSQKEIEDKIKATMARLSGGGKNKRQKIRRDKRLDRNERREQAEMAAGEMKTLQLTEFVTVSELASLLDVSVTDVIMTCMNLGVMVSINQRLDAEIIEFVSNEFHHEVEFINAEDQIEMEDVIPDAEEDLLPRAPIVTVMGHVDHGKTSLLDHIRKANVASGEAGGITQHIGAYEVKLDSGKRITFLDTPGHEAFTAMRARGAKVTDVAVIIVAADDNIMPQTREAIAHATAAQVPIIFAINKIDKAGADPERIKNELAQMNFLVEDWGGKYQSQDISAKKGTNIDLLLEKILLEAEILDLKANPNKKANGTVIEASLDKGRGYVTKLLVQEGTLEEGEPLVAGEFSGRVRAMFNERGQRVKTAGPSTPVLILGLGGAPQAGEKFKIAANESEARQIASKRAQISREQANRASKRISLDEIGRRLALGSFKELKLIIKGDVDGSVEALADSLIKQSVASIQVNVIHKAVGQIIESDVLLASASDAIIIGFQVRPSIGARKIAEREGVEIKLYSVIYEAIDEIRAAMEGMLEPTKEEKETAQVEVREVYKISKVGTIAGCYVQEGKLFRNNFIRVIRDGIVVFPNREGQNGKITSLKRFKEDVREVRHQMECGIMIDGFNDIQIGDIIEAYEIIEVKQKLK
ncbi:MAG: translation initiation factor IF-2 [Saprospiraceae bacterium]